jgi:psp operon transcriptional activator
LERADGGTLFLDELATTRSSSRKDPAHHQYGEFVRVGGSKRCASAWLVAATNEDLPALADKGVFRRDLLDRLAFDVITLPPLRQRPDDIVLLAEHFAINMATELGQTLFPGFTDRARDALLTHAWPGNVRELKNVVERCVYRNADPLKPVDVITLDPFESPFRPRATAAPQPAGANRGPLPICVDLKETVQELRSIAQPRARGRSLQPAQRTVGADVPPAAVTSRYNLLKPSDTASEWLIALLLFTLLLFTLFTCNAVATTDVR